MWSKASLLVVVIMAAQAAGQAVQVEVPKNNVKVKLEVELRGMLSFSDKEVTLKVEENEIEAKLHGFVTVVKSRTWIVELGDAKELREKAKNLDGKMVIVKGNATLLGIKTRSVTYKPGVPLNLANKERELPDLVATTAELDLEHKVDVKSLLAAPKE
jgi:hypothetical protein